MHKANHVQLSNKVGKGGSFRTSTKGYANKSLPIHLLGIHGCVLLKNKLLKGAEDPQVCKKTISYICPYLIASVVHHQICIYTCNDNYLCKHGKNCLNLEYSVTSLVISLKCIANVAITVGNPKFKSPLIEPTSHMQ